MPTLIALLALQSAQAASNERNAAATLKTFASASADFRANDRDGNRINDFWVGDVSGLYRIDPGDGAIKLIEISAAAADAKPCVPLDKAGALGSTKLVAVPGGAATKAGYRYAAVPKYQPDEGPGKPYDEGGGRCPAKFAFCAWPAEHGPGGTATFLITEENIIWKRNTGGQAVTVVPRDPASQGWTRLD
ncbi:MAG TPA: DUF2950 family protein [Planctomycetota bacterium]